MRKRGADVDLQASQRVKFFQLTDLFLASPLVPAYTAAAFIKRFARLSLRTSPAGMPSSPPSLPSSPFSVSFLYASKHTSELSLYFYNVHTSCTHPLQALGGIVAGFMGARGHL